MNTTAPNAINWAAPTQEDVAYLKSLTPEQRKILLAAELAKGRADIEAGRFTELASDEDIRALFDEIWAVDEVKAL